jgi:hypothetical protein
MSEREEEIVKASAKALRDLYQDDFGGVLPWHLLDRMEREYYREQARVVLAISRPLILEEAAKVADEMAVNRARVSSAAAYASRSIADRIRSLSHPYKEKGDE